MSKSNLSTKVPYKVACEHQPGGGKDGVRMGNELEWNGQDKQTLL